MAAVEVRTERVDDIPLLLRQQSKMGLPEIVDGMIQTHGNRAGLSLGWLSAGWLASILSEADHRMAEVEAWAAQRLGTLALLIPQPVQAKDVTDDRLADVLSKLGDDAVWEAVESRLGQHLVRVSNLQAAAVRLASTTAAVYHDAEEGTLLRYGHSKDHRPDLAQFKVMLASLDPLGLPLATLVVPGNQADDGRYEPAIHRARQVVGQGGRRYLGDAKMAALATRACVQSSGDYYLTPLPLTGDAPDLLRRLLEPLWQRQQALERIARPAAQDEAGAGADGKAVATTPKVRPALLALGFETTRSPQTHVQGAVLAWHERVLVSYSLSLAKPARQGLQQRLSRAEAALLALTPPRGKGRRQHADVAELQAAAQAVLKQQRVEGLLEVSYVHAVQDRPIRRYAGRPGRLARRERYVVAVRRNPQAIAVASRRLGWRLYVTNAPQAELSLAEAVWAYRGAPAIERGFHRLKGRSLGLRPLFVQRADHVRGLARLLALGLRVLTLVEPTVRAGLEQAGQSLRGLYAGNPKRETARPTTERLLQAFKGITLTVVKLPEQTVRHVPALSPLQHRILTLAGLPASIYDQLAPSLNPIPP